MQQEENCANTTVVSTPANTSCYEEGDVVRPHALAVCLLCVSCNIICVRDYMPWLQSVLSIHRCKGAAASVNQEGLKTSVNKHINLIVFIYLIS